MTALSPIASLLAALTAQLPPAGAAPATGFLDLLVAAEGEEEAPEGAPDVGEPRPKQKKAVEEPDPGAYSWVPVLPVASAEPSPVTHALDLPRTVAPDRLEAPPPIAGTDEPIIWEQAPPASPNEPAIRIPAPPEPAPAAGSRAVELDVVTVPVVAPDGVIAGEPEPPPMPVERTQAEPVNTNSLATPALPPESEPETVQAPIRPEPVPTRRDEEHPAPAGRPDTEIATPNPAPPDAEFDAERPPAMAGPQPPSREEIPRRRLSPCPADPLPMRPEAGDDGARLQPPIDAMPPIAPGVFEQPTVSNGLNALESTPAPERAAPVAAETVERRTVPAARETVRPPLAFSARLTPAGPAAEPIARAERVNAAERLNGVEPTTGAEPPIGDEPIAGTGRRENRMVAPRDRDLLRAVPEPEESRPESEGPEAPRERVLPGRQPATAPPAHPLESAEMPESPQSIGPKPHVERAAARRREIPTAPPIARDIRLEIGGPDRKVEVRLVERAGEVRLAVRTPDDRLAEGLRENLPLLSSRLEQSGFRADEWRAAAAGSAERRLEVEAAANGSADTRQHGHPQDRGQERRESDPRASRDTEQQTRRNQEKGNPFAWLMQSLR